MLETPVVGEYAASRKQKFLRRGSRPVPASLRRGSVRSPRDRGCAFQVESLPARVVVFARPGVHLCSAASAIEQAWRLSMVSLLRGLEAQPAFRTDENYRCMHPADHRAIMRPNSPRDKIEVVPLHHDDLPELEVTALPLVTLSGHLEPDPEETSPGRGTSRGAIRDPLLSDADRFYRGGSPFPRRVLRSPSGGPSTSSGPCAIFKRPGLAVGCPRVAQMSGPAGVGRRIARYIVSGWALLWL